MQKLLRAFKAGRVTEKEVVARLATLPYEDLGCAKVDHHRALRRGAPEVIFCRNKTPGQTARIAAAMAKSGSNVLATHASPAHFEAVIETVPGAAYHESARCITAFRRKPRPRGRIAVVTAGTADEPVAEEAVVTAEFLGSCTERFYDVGVAGIHRVLDNLPAIRKARPVIVAAGMEGALASVVGGLVRGPVIAVPTSVGYGAGAGGITPLLAMLNSCAGGVAVVNIDNGFGAGYVAHLINCAR